MGWYQRRVHGENWEALKGPGLMDDYNAQQAFLEEAKKDEAAKPLVSGFLPVAALREQFPEPGVFRAKVEHLCKTYSSVVFMRRDGNCFIRGFATGLLLFLRNHATTTEGKRLLEALKGSLKFACEHGYEEFILEDFHDVFIEAAEAAIKAPSDNAVLEQMAVAETSDYVVMFLRCLVGAYMKSRPELFLSFLPDVVSMADYVKSEVEPMGRESEETSIMALTDYLRVGVRIEYLDLSVAEGSQKSDDVMPTNTHIFPLEPADGIAFTMLYRPGHFDLVS